MSRVKKIIFVLLAAALLLGSGRMQKMLNRDRAQLGFTRENVLKNAPPVLAFTTVALGGFRGLISNFLWIRANNLQMDDKFFEAAQLADWITDLEPHYPQVWAFESWNMAYNISVKFKDFPDRWRWVENGIELLRDRGLRYNPNELLIYRELAWLFQNKMGANLDDANVYYKQQWAKEMTPFFGPEGTNFSELLNPTTAQARTNVIILRDKYKIDPAFAKKVDEEWGPLDWRVPEAHAIYWGARGLAEAKKHPKQVTPDDLIILRRIIYQSMLQAFHHGRIITDPFSKTYALEPNLDLVSKVNAAYETEYAEEKNPNQQQGILKAHRNFLRDAVYFLYENDRIAEAAKWYKILGQKYPDKIILDGDTNSYPRNLTLDEYAVRRVQEELGDTSQERTTGVVEGLLQNAYYALAIGQDSRYAGFKLLARKVYEHYNTAITGHGGNTKRTVERIGLPPFNVLNRTVLNQLLDTQHPVLPFAARAVIRTELEMLPETNAPPATINSTNAIAPSVPPPTTNAPPTNSVGK
ncbi:MAG: hypothetical protein ACREFE_05295 [Limisphaerales bacterium]